MEIVKKLEVFNNTNNKSTVKDTPINNLHGVPITQMKAQTFRIRKLEIVNIYQQISYTKIPLHHHFF